MSDRKVKIRAKYKNGKVTVKALMSHPMETGLRKDKATGKLVPEHFIKTVTCESAGQEIMKSYWNVTISKNPYFSFKYEGNKGDEFKLSWVDNQGEQGTTTAIVK